MGKTKIDWCDASWNPIRARDKKTGAVGHYCQKVSSGCANCFSSAMQRRFKMPSFPGEGKGVSDDIEIFLDVDVLRQPFHWRKPRMIFPCSMTDLFGAWIADEWIDELMHVIHECPQHIFQILTKRPERMAEYLNDYWVRLDVDDNEQHPLHNVWFLTSIENQRTANERIPHLLQCPAVVRGLSIEPLLGEIDLHSAFYVGPEGGWEWWGASRQIINWAIIGSESKAGRAGRFADGYEEAARSLIQQCKAAGVAVYHKQMPIGGRVSHDPSEWPEDLRVRQFPAVEGVTNDKS